MMKNLKGNFPYLISNWISIRNQPNLSPDNIRNKRIPINCDIWDCYTFIQKKLAYRLEEVDEKQNFPIVTLGSREGREEG